MIRQIVGLDMDPNVVISSRVFVRFIVASHTKLARPCAFIFIIIFCAYAFAVLFTCNRFGSQAGKSGLGLTRVTCIVKCFREVEAGVPTLPEVLVTHRVSCYTSHQN